MAITLKKITLWRKPRPPSPRLTLLRKPQRGSLSATVVYRRPARSGSHTRSQAPSAIGGWMISHGSSFPWSRTSKSLLANRERSTGQLPYPNFRSDADRQTLSYAPAYERGACRESSRNSDHARSRGINPGTHFSYLGRSSSSSIHGTLEEVKTCIDGRTCRAKSVWYKRPIPTILREC